MNRFYSLIFIVFSAHNLMGQNVSDFPKSWQGIWQGDLAIYQGSGLVQQVEMELHILPIDSTDRYTWTLIYGDDKEAGKRPYELVTIDAEKGVYKIDEKNSIELEGYFFQDKFFSRFEVMGSLLLSTQQLVGETLVFEIIVGSIAPINVTGGEVVAGDTIPPGLSPKNWTVG